MLKAYKYRIYPNKKQQAQIEKTFDCCRFVYNRTLMYRREMYENCGVFVSRMDCNNYRTRELKAKYSWLKEVDKFALTNAVYHMDSAYQNFFKNRSGYPRFKSRYSEHKSYTTNFTNGNIAIDFEEGRVKLVYADEMDGMEYYFLGANG
ncbi:MAG: helix-turn-helix domain-containing protein, partial [Lachnospiraceae bacterium]|nr:helix-turn-helix domain-containing protein [Lachnospiraceae bacterium]